jgi:transcription elongation factor Elf1
MKGYQHMDVRELNMDVKELTDMINHTERFLDEHHNCPLCGTEMLVTHVTHFIELNVKEEAHCEACKIKVRELDHLLQ